MPYDDRYYNIHSYRGGNGYSMNGGYSMNPMNYQDNNRYSRSDAKDRMVDNLYSMMNDAQSEAERTAIQDCINRLKG